MLSKGNIFVTQPEQLEPQIVHETEISKQSSLVEQFKSKADRYLKDIPQFSLKDQNASIRETIKLLTILLLLLTFVYAYRNFIFGIPEKKKEQIKKTEQKKIVPKKNSLSQNLIAFFSPLHADNTITAQAEVEVLPSPTPSIFISSQLNTVDLAKKISQQYSIPESTFLCVIQYESGFQSHYSDGSLKCGDSGRSCGLGQIQYPTWRSIRSHSGMSLDDLRGDDYENLVTTAYGLSHGWKYHWTGYNICASQGYTL